MRPLGCRGTLVLATWNCSLKLLPSWRIAVFRFFNSLVWRIIGHVIRHLAVAMVDNLVGCLRDLEEGVNCAIRQQKVCHNEVTVINVVTAICHKKFLVICYSCMSFRTVIDNFGHILLRLVCLLKFAAHFLILCDSFYDHCFILSVAMHVQLDNHFRIISHPFPWVRPS